MNKDYAFCHSDREWQSLAGDINRRAISLGQSFVSDSVSVTLTFPLPPPSSSAFTVSLSSSPKASPRSSLSPALGDPLSFPTSTHLCSLSASPLCLPPTYKRSLFRFPTPPPSVTVLAQSSSLRAQTTSPRRCLSNPVFHHSALSSFFSHSHHAISHHKSSNRPPLEPPRVIKELHSHHRNPSFSISFCSVSH